jgi:hypothetical protein
MGLSARTGQAVSPAGQYRIEVVVVWARDCARTGKRIVLGRPQRTSSKGNTRPSTKSRCSLSYALKVYVAVEMPTVLEIFWPAGVGKVVEAANAGGAIVGGRP